MALAREDLLERSHDDGPLLALLGESGAQAESAFGELYRKYRLPLLRRVRSRVSDNDLAEEIVQESFAKAWKAAARFAGPGHFYGWLCTIADRLCVDNWRRARNREELVGDHDESAAPLRNEPEAHVLALADAEDVRTAYRKLSPRYQELLRLREIEGLSYRSVAERMDMSESAVETALFRARGALRTYYKGVSGTSFGVFGALLAAWKVARRVAGRFTSASVFIPTTVAVVAAVTLIAVAPHRQSVTEEPIVQSPVFSEVESVPAAATTTLPVPTAPVAEAPVAEVPAAVVADTTVPAPTTTLPAPQSSNTTLPPADGAANLPDSVVVENPAVGPVECDCGAEAGGVNWVIDHATDPLGTISSPPGLNVPVTVSLLTTPTTRSH